LIKKLHDETDRDWNDFTILYRTNAQSTPFEKALLADGIPYKIIGAFKFFERKEVKDIIGYLKFIANSSDTIALMRIINTPARDIGPTTIKYLEEIAAQAQVTPAYAFKHLDTLANTVSSAQATKLKFFAHQMRTLQEQLTIKTPQEILEQIILLCNYKAYLEKMH
jgi:DNA helicase II / ATP-dependent DNA helicase PcrA